MLTLLEYSIKILQNSSSGIIRHYTSWFNLFISLNRNQRQWARKIWDQFFPGSQLASARGTLRRAFFNEFNGGGGLGGGELIVFVYLFRRFWKSRNAIHRDWYVHKRTKFGQMKMKVNRNDALRRQLKSELEGKVNIEHWNFNWF